MRDLLALALFAAVRVGIVAGFASEIGGARVALPHRSDASLSEAGTVQRAERTETKTHAGGEG